MRVVRQKIASRRLKNREAAACKQREAREQQEETAVAEQLRGEAPICELSLIGIVSGSIPASRK